MIIVSYHIVPTSSNVENGLPNTFNDRTILSAFFVVVLSLVHYCGVAGGNALLSGQYQDILSVKMVSETNLFL